MKSVACLASAFSLFLVAPRDQDLSAKALLRALQKPEIAVCICVLNAATESYFNFSYPRWLKSLVVSVKSTVYLSLPIKCDLVAWCMGFPRRTLSSSLKPDTELSSPNSNAGRCQGFNLLVRLGFIKLNAVGLPSHLFWYDQTLPRLVLQDLMNYHCVCK